MIYLSQSLLLSESASIDLGSPILLWQSYFDRFSVTATSESEDYPATNLATDSMIEPWRATVITPVTINLTIGGRMVDAVGIAKHNLGTSQAVITIEEEVTVGGVTSWQTIIPDQMLGDNTPALFRMAPRVVTSLRIRISGGNVPASIAILYVGELLIMPHGITNGHTPLDYAIDTNVVNGVSESGNYLGRVIVGQSAETNVSFESLYVDDWFYNKLGPFIKKGMAGPFFFSWLPQKRPSDVGFAWLTSDPKPVMTSVFYDITFNIAGVTW